MQKFFWIIFLSLATFATQNIPLLQSGNYKYWCPITGENLQEHFATNYTAKLTNGTIRQYSSIYGLYFDMKEYGILPQSIQKYDTNKSKFIEVKLSELKYDEDKFLQDKKWLENIKVKKLYKMGEKIFVQKCKKQNIAFDNFLEINELKGYLVQSKLCGDLSEEYLHPLGMYLWDIKKSGLVQNKNFIHIDENDKCPVCGMFAHKYPKWVAKLHFGEKYFAFDGVKDLMKFYFNPLRWGKYAGTTKDKITSFEVTDYYTQNSIDGFKAFYVIRSDIYGPMGNELIPFYKLEDAKTFQKDHNGKRILKFMEITENIPYELDSK